MGEQGPYQAFCVYMPVSLFASSASRVAYRMACLKAKQWWEFSRCGRDRIPGEETHRRDVQPSRIRSFRPLLKPTGFSRWLFSFYSDGVTETENGAGEFFEESRLVELVRRNGELDPQALIDRVRGAVVEFSQSESFADDLTCVAVKIEKWPSRGGRWAA
jgi:hypothetical protein